jgi:hypothetical protein
MVVGRGEIKWCLQVIRYLPHVHHKDRTIFSSSLLGPRSWIDTQGTLCHWEEPAVMILDLEQDFSNCFISFGMSWLFGSSLLH